MTVASCSVLVSGNVTPVVGAHADSNTTWPGGRGLSLHAAMANAPTPNHEATDFTETTLAPSTIAAVTATRMTPLSRSLPIRERWYSTTKRCNPPSVENAVRPLKPTLMSWLQLRPEFHKTI